MPKVVRPAIPEPQQTLVSVQATAGALKQAVEIMQGQRGGMEMATVRWQDLVNLGLIDPTQVPQR